MSLLKLPSEILQQVISLVVPETFEAVALVCRRTYAASSPFLKRHNALRKRFRNFQFSGRDELSQPSGSSDSDAAEGETLDGDENKDQHKGEDHANEDEDATNIRSVLTLLLYIAKHPVVARYMVSVDLSHDYLDEYAEVEEFVAKVDSSGILQLLQDSPYLNKRGYDPYTWLEALKQIKDDYADIFLLTLLPNVKELVISDRMAENSYSYEDSNEDGGGMARSPILQCRSILEDIVDQANQHPQSNAALSRLRVVQNDPGWNDDYETKNDLTNVSSLLAIQSVCKFYGNSFVAIEDGYTGVEFHPRYTRLSPNLEEIILDHCILGAATARKLFSRIENLRVFRLSWTVKYHGCGSNWDTGALFYSLEQVAGHTLEELSIHDLGDTNLTGTVLTNMKGFKRLRVFETDMSFLCGEPFDPARQSTDELEGGIEPGNIYDEGEDMPDKRVDPFVDFFSPTIERAFFSVDSLGIMSHLSSFLDRMHEERAIKLPQLKEICFAIPTPREYLTFDGRPSQSRPSVSEQRAKRDALVTLITNCGGTVETIDWQSPWEPFRAA